MLKNFIITSVRYLRRNFLIVGINILGLAIALALCITAYLSSKYDMDWDKTHSNYENIYKINITREIQDRQQEYGITPIALAPLLNQDLVGVEEVTRYRNSYSPVKFSDKIFSKNIAFVDPNFLKVFTLDIIKGNKNALAKKGNILINERIANVYFGEEDPLGKVISIVNEKNQETTFIVAGIYKNLPQSSSFGCELLTQLENFEDMWEIEAEKWDSWVGATYLLVRNENNIPNINEQLKKYIAFQNDINEEWIITSFFTKTLKQSADDFDVWSNWQRSSLHPAGVVGPPIMAIFILIIAAFNFMNSSISFAGKRLKEIGLRKVFGSLRKHIVIQFLSENLMISFIAIVFGIFISGFLAPAYGNMWQGLELEFSFTEDTTLIVFIIILWLFTALLAGAYPAFYISKFNPIKIFREKLKLKNKNLLSRFLLWFQFFTSVMTLVMGVIFAQNGVFQDNVDLGYDKENLIILSMHNSNDYKPFEQIVKANPKIEMYAGTNYHIGYGNYDRSIKYLDQQIETNIMNIGYDYLPAMKVKVKDGRGFNLENQSGDFVENSVVVNEKFVNDFGLKDPVGKTIYMNDTLALQIIGVSNDVYLYGAWAPVDPLIYRLAQEEDFGRIVIRTASQNLSEVNEILKKEWAELVPNYPYKGKYQEELIEQVTEVNNNIRIMFSFLAVCALFLTVIGLYTLVSLSVLNRTKELGIRKVHGASVKRIMLIISKPFTLLIMGATVFGSVGGYFLAMMTLGSIYKMHMTPNVISFIIPILVIVLTTIITIIWRVYKAASQNPANSLRYE